MFGLLSLTRYDVWMVFAGAFIYTWLFDYSCILQVSLAFIGGILYGWGTIYDPRNEDPPDPVKEKIIAERARMWEKKAQEENRK